MEDGNVWNDEVQPPHLGISPTLRPYQQSRRQSGNGGGGRSALQARSSGGGCARSAARAPLVAAAAGGSPMAIVGGGGSTSGLMLSPSQLSNSVQIATNGTIEDQMRQVDKVMKECDHARKSLEIITRRLDDLNDEVKRYRDFLGYEKARRDPALYKTTNVDRPSVYNDSICVTFTHLTAQLTQQLNNRGYAEWTEKLRSLHNSMQQPPSTPVSRSGDRL